METRRTGTTATTVDQALRDTAALALDIAAEQLMKEGGFMPLVFLFHPSGQREQWMLDQGMLSGRWEKAAFLAILREVIRNERIVGLVLVSDTTSHDLNTGETHEAITAMLSTPRTCQLWRHWYRRTEADEIELEERETAPRDWQVVAGEFSNLFNRQAKSASTTVH
jgi:hypothetical protein